MELAREDNDPCSSIYTYMWYVKEDTQSLSSQMSLQMYVPCMAYIQAIELDAYTNVLKLVDVLYVAISTI